MTLEVKILTSTRMVQVNRHSILLDFDDGGIEAAAILSHHRHDSTLMDIVEIYLSVHHEHRLWHIEHQLIVEIPVSISTGDDEIKLIATHQVTHILLELLEHQIKTADELERMTAIGHLHRLLILLAILDGEELIRKRDVLVIYFHNKDI